MIRNDYTAFSAVPPIFRVNLVSPPVSTVFLLLGLSRGHVDLDLVNGTWVGDGAEIS